MEKTGRVIGFFDGHDKFIAIDDFIKKKRKLTRSQIGIIDKVVRIKEKKLWIPDIGGQL